ncbi:MAG: C40 family peptidase [Treponema sp.]|nr:C40 family peptidase [Treponema sp.]
MQKKVLVMATLLACAACVLFAATGKTSKAGQSQKKMQKQQTAQVRKASGNPYGAYRAELIQFAMTLRGKPYKTGGQGPNAFDCSGFLNYAVKQSLGKYSLKIDEFPRLAADIYRKVVPISPSEREPGDLIFFSDHGKISHVGLYMGRYKDTNPADGIDRLDGRIVFLNAASAGPKTGVVLSAVDEPYWKKHFYGYGRFLKSGK